ncbi:MAG: sugar phosphate isomerase/epimerase, partial [Hyphomicrobiales bacterium]|nr:sugar phosphate isomerase/epimerase [Hyphomicrobiales bacterium]
MASLENVSFQLYSARMSPPAAAQVATLAGLGYRNVEPYGGLLADADALAAALTAHHVGAPTTHVGLADLERDFAGVAAAARKLGVKTLIAPALPAEERSQDLAGWKAVAGRLAAAGKRASDEGFAFAWHNHAFEFADIAGGGKPLDVLLGEAPAIGWQADLGWIARAGEDPLAWMQKYSGRVVALHVKDMAPHGTAEDEDGWADVGHGALPLEAWVAAVRAAGAKT